MHVSGLLILLISRYSWNITYVFQDANQTLFPGGSVANNCSASASSNASFTRHLDSSGGYVSSCSQLVILELVLIAMPRSYMPMSPIFFQKRAQTVLVVLGTLKVRSVAQVCFHSHKYFLIARQVVNGSFFIQNTPAQGGVGSYVTTTLTLPAAPTGAAKNGAKSNLSLWFGLSWAGLVLSVTSILSQAWSI